jgi:ribosome-binding protein aMBF1 (putative translation factor)
MNKKKKAENYTSPAIYELMDETDEKEYKRTEKRMMMAARIDEAKRAKGWKNKDLAKALGKKPSEISKYLSGTHNFTIDTLSDLEEVLGIQLLNLKEKPKTQILYNKNITVSSDIEVPSTSVNEPHIESDFFTGYSLKKEC